MMGDPPLLDGGLKATVIGPVLVEVEPETACTAAGENGGVPGITALEADYAGPVPTALVAVTLKL
jgi:hypothetical protein